MDVRSSSTHEVDENKIDRSKIYFFLIAIAALLFTNVYFLVKFKSSGEKLYTVALQREELQREVDRAEAELDNVKNTNLEGIPEDILKEEQSARAVISDLRVQLDDVNFTEKQIQDVKKVIQNLKERVTVIKDDTNELRLQNELLRAENEALSNAVEEKSSALKDLHEHTEDLNRKVSVASSVKVSNIFMNGVKENRKGLYEIDSRARRIDKLQIKFTIADNELAKEGMKDVYVRVIDPEGNLIANSSNIFYVKSNSKLQYTFKERISFTNNGEEYEFLWSDDNKFKKGAYTVLLYADGAIMGRSSIILK